MNLSEQDRDRIDDLMDQFDFSLVEIRIAERELDFDRMPTETELRKEARGLLKSLFLDNLQVNTSEHFVATKIDGRIDLYFHIEHQYVD